MPVSDKVPWKRAAERVKLPFTIRCAGARKCASRELSCLGLQLESGGKFLLRLNMRWKPIVHKYREGKMQRTLKRELKST